MRSSCATGRYSSSHQLKCNDCYKGIWVQSVATHALLAVAPSDYPEKASAWKRYSDDNKRMGVVQAWGEGQIQTSTEVILVKR